MDMPVRCIRNPSQPASFKYSHFVFIEYTTYSDAYRGSCATTTSTNFALKMLMMASRWWAGSQQTRTLLTPTVAPGAVALITINGQAFRRAISSKLNIVIITIRWSCFRVATQCVYCYY
uniref:Uncharacterized protein n=1 Tax=Schizaphis graminum TaxID=13262 RepID=A0A2S2NGZ0_SCHGA